jgi:hypothetical protein
MIVTPKKNSQLSNAEKDEKKRLKSELKHQRRVQKLQTRIKHAVCRKDAIVEESARKELDELLRKNVDVQHQMQQEQAASDERYEQVMLLARDVFHRLLSKWNEKQQRFSKTEQNKNARDLLQHMTKGTQTEKMFKDVTALRGYTRQKFYSRAGLIVESLCKLSPQQSSLSNQRDVIDACWKSMSKITKICSIGCGPGCDAVGLLAFLQGFNQTGDISPSPLHFILLDYAIKEWKVAVLNDLEPILTESFGMKIICEYCDVTIPLREQHRHILPLLEATDMFLTSYLLTETRDKWDAYFVELVEKAKKGAMFYFAEPLPWQLHRLIRMSTSNSGPSPLKRLRFAWMDSSMNHPELQVLDGRAGGPALLFAIKF